MKRQQTRKQKSPWYFKLALVYFLGILISQIALSNSFAARTTELKDLYAQKEELQKDVSMLRFQDSSLSSMTTLEDRALQLGFIKNSDALASVNITLPVTLASASIR